MTDSVTAALLPCPFCGGEASGYPAFEDANSSMPGCYITCPNCDCSPDGCYRIADEWPQAVAIWNTRTPAMRKLDPALAIPNDEGIREALINVRRMLPNVATLLDTIKVEWTQAQREALTSNMIAIDKALAATPSPVEDDEMIERVARAIWIEEGLHLCPSLSKADLAQQWNNLETRLREASLNRARAAIAATKGDA